MQPVGMCLQSHLAFFNLIQWEQALFINNILPKQQLNGLLSAVCMGTDKSCIAGQPLRPLKSMSKRVIRLTATVLSPITRIFLKLWLMLKVLLLEQWLIVPYAVCDEKLKISKKDGAGKQGLRMKNFIDNSSQMFKGHSIFPHKTFN